MRRCLDWISISRNDIYMIKTVIALEPEIKKWLDQRAAQEGVPMTELVRRAVRLLQQQEIDRFDEVLKRGRGTWTAGDGLEYQLKIRSEWSRNDDLA